MASELVTHALQIPAIGRSAAPIVVREEEPLGLIALGECSRDCEDGEAAIQLVLNAVCNQLSLSSDDLERYRREPGDALRSRLLEAMQEAVQRGHRELALFGRRRGGDLGVGLELLLRAGSEILAAHVGHGGIYLVRRDLLHRLARGARQTSGLVRGGSWDEPPGEPALLGGEAPVSVQTMVFEVWPGDHLALLSGGLASRLEDSDLRTLLAVLEPEQAARGLLHMARERGSSVAMGAFLARVPGQPAQVQESVVSLLPVLGRIPLLNWCNREDLLDVAAVARPLRVAAGDVVFAEGDHGDELFLLVQGDVSVTRAGTGVAHLGPGSTFGEMALLDQPMRSATVEALCEGELLVISREKFFGLLKSSPNLAVKLLWNLLIAVSGKLRTTTAVMTDLVAGSDEPKREHDEVPTLTMRRRR
jgi:CRP-like cAMP-binding protein/serine/threonine protein phosphatase PrpC